MATVDDRVVNMRFNNSQFEQGASQTLSTLDKLKNALNFGGSKKSLDDLSSSASRFNFGPLSTSIDGVSTKLLALGTIGVTALANIANRAVNAGLSLAKSFTIAPITQGFSEYETKLGSIQTILANTARYGTNLDQVNKSLNELNDYADKTIYNFGDMTKNIGLFTNAGIRVEDATAMIKGFSNAAAASGTNAQGAAGAAYQLSQALSTGTIRLMDWRSLTNVGMGNKNMQEGLIQIADAMGTLEKSGTSAKDVQKDFNGSLQKGWLSADVMSKYLRIMAGDMDAAKMKSLGLSDAQIKTFLAQQKTAQDAATKVRTLTQLIGTAREAVGSGWAQTAEILFGNFNEATDLFTSINNALSDFIGKSADARNKVLSDWKALGGRKELIDGVRAAFEALGSVVKPIKEAFRDIFPPKTGRDLYNLTVAFTNFMKSLKMGAENSENLKRTFRGFFALLDIGKQIVSGVFRVISDLFGSMKGGASSLLNVTGGLGDWLVRLDEALKKGDRLRNFFDDLGRVLTIPITILKGLGSMIGGLFSGFKQGDASGMANALGEVGDKLSDISEFGDRVRDFFERLGNTLRPLGKAVGNAFGDIGNSIADSVKNLKFDQVMDVLQTGLFGGFLLLLKKFSKGLKVEIGGGLFGSVKEMFETLTGSLKALQTQIKAKTLLMIAGAIGILAISMTTLSMIDPKKLANALKAMAAGFAELLGTMAILTKISGAAGFVKVPIIAGSMILLAGAIDLLTIAVANLSRLSWEELKKGLTAVGVLLGIISVAVIPISANSGGMVRAGIGITAIAVAMNVLYLAVKSFSKLKWSELGKGMAAVAGSLLAIAGAMHLMPPGMALQAAGILEISIALNALYLAVKSFSGLDWKEIGKGLAGVAGTLTAIAIGMQLMPKGIVAQSAGLVIIAAALMLLSKALGMLGKKDWSTLGKGIGAVAVSLGILAGGMRLMQGAIPGAAALIVASGALMMLVPVITALSKLTWGQLIKSMVALASVFAVLGVSALLLSPVAPALLAIGVAIAAMGLGIGAAAAGLGLLAKGLGTLAKLGSGGVAILLDAVEGLIEMIPDAAVKFGEGLVKIVQVIGKNAPTIIASFGKILEQLLQLIITKAPMFGTAIAALITTLLKVVRDKAPDIIATGFKLLMDLLSGIRDHIGEVITTTTDIIVNFINGIANNIGRIIQAGVNLLTQFLVGVATALGKMPGVALKVIVAFVTSLVGNFGQIFSTGGRALGKFVSGIAGGLKDAVTAGANAVGHFISGLGSKVSDIVSKGVQALGHFVHGILNAMDEAVSQAATAAGNIAQALIDGVWNGVKSLGGWLKDKILGLFKGIWNGIKGLFGIDSPSKEMYWLGQMLVYGLTNAIDDTGKKARDSANAMATGVMNEMSKTLGKSKYDFSDIIENAPKITPVLDLSGVSKEASKINSMLATKPIVPSTSYLAASGIAVDRQQATQEAASQPVAPVVQQPITFEQKNYSPEALSTTEIYRQTRNLLGQAKAVLGVPTS